MVLLHGNPQHWYERREMAPRLAEQFTVIAFIFDGDGTLRSRQAAPGRRTLEKRSTKYSTMVIDVRPLTSTSSVNRPRPVTSGSSSLRRASRSLPNRSTLSLTTPPGSAD